MQIEEKREEERRLSVGTWDGKDEKLPVA